MTDSRPVRICDVCGGVDDHPRHVIAYATNDGVTDAAVAALAVKNAGDTNLESVLTQIQDTSTVMRHMDCCREVGCPDGTCNSVPEDLKGDELVAHLTQEN